MGGQNALHKTPHDFPRVVDGVVSQNEIKNIVLPEIISDDVVGVGERLDAKPYQIGQIR
jgi:hypothetical protein